MNVNILKRMARYVIKGIPQKIIKADIHYTLPSAKLQGKKIIITGGGKGIGLAIAERCVKEGAKVLITGRNEMTLQQSAAKIGCLYLRQDMQQFNKFPTFMEKAFCMLDGVDCLINNAGISLHEQGFLDVSLEQFDNQFNTNLKGAFFFTQAFIRHCESVSQNNTKNILFVSSETSMTVDERPYGLTKAALNSLVQGLAYRFANKGYRINAVAPGVTISDMVGKNDDDNLTYDNNMTGRYYLPEEVAEVACFLLSDASNCLNGQVLVCNEGKTINARWK